MPNPSDAQLLRDYTAHGSEHAFGEIVARYTGLIYFAALRQCDSPERAREIAQGVFTDLARKAPALAGELALEASLAGWLYRGTRYAALTQRRDERRRQERERLVMEHLNPAADAAAHPAHDPAADWDRVAPVLDEAMAELNDTDREAVLLRFFQNQDFHAVGLALGVSDDAAQKRVSRAVERLREFLAKRGVTVGASGLVVVISTNAVLMAPTGLSAAITAAAVAGTTVATAATAITMTTLQKTLIAAALAAALGAGIYEARQVSTLQTEKTNLQEQQAEMAGQIHSLERELGDATNLLTFLLKENAPAKNQSTELLKLRGEVGMLRQQTSELQKLGSENSELRTNLTVVQAQVLQMDTIKAMQLVTYSIHLYEESHNGESPVDFAQLKELLGPIYPGFSRIDMLNAFEIVAKPIAPADQNRPNRLIAQERVARLMPDGKWWRLQGFADGSVKSQISNDRQFEQPEKIDSQSPKFSAPSIYK